MTKHHDNVRAEIEYGGRGGEPGQQDAGMIDFNVTVVDDAGNLITKPLVVRIDAGLSGTVRNTNPANFYHGPPLERGTRWLGDVEVIADGYAPWTTGANPQIVFEDQTVNILAALTPSFKRPPSPIVVVPRGPLPPFAPPYTAPYIAGMDVLPWPANVAVSVLDAPDALSRQPGTRLAHWRAGAGRKETHGIVAPLAVTPSSAPRERDYLRADSWGVVMEGAPQIDRGVSPRHPERIMSWFIDRYTLEFQKEYLEKYAGYGYTHLRLSYADSTAAKDQPMDKPPGAGRSLEQLIETCHLVKRYVPYVKMMIGSKYFQPHNMSAQQWADVSDPVIDALIAAKAIDELSLSWEHNLWNQPGRPTIDAFKHAGQRAHAAGLSFWMHFSAHVTSWFQDGDPRGRFGFYDDISPDVNGLDYQTDPSWPMDETQARIVDSLWQFGQRHDGVKFRFDEDMASAMWNNDKPDSEDANGRGYLACCTFDNVKWGPAKVWGFGNGGRMPDGSPI